MRVRAQASDGSFDRFLAQYQAINWDGLGRVGLAELSAYLVYLKAHGGSSCGAAAAAGHGQGRRGDVAVGAGPGSGSRPGSGAGSQHLPRPSARFAPSSAGAVERLLQL
jgi:hypothetical protein